MCGEKSGYSGLRAWARGSPPRVRGKVFCAHLCLMFQRITPACAGKSPMRPEVFDSPEDHPRVCGEKRILKVYDFEFEGSPPRVRGKVVLDLQAVKDSGITPACAGKSLLLGDKHRTAQDHPRVCGEKCGITSRTSWEKGSPPRVRGKDVVVKGHSSKEGITPACAGKRRER